MKAVVINLESKIEAFDKTLLNSMLENFVKTDSNKFSVNLLAVCDTLLLIL